MLKKLIFDHKKAGTQLFWLAALDLKKTYSGSILGWAWAVIKPAVMIAVYWFVLSVGLRAGSDIQGVDFASWLVVGMLAWFFIKDMLNAGTRCFKRYRYLVSKVKFPVITIPTFIAFSALFVNVILGVFIVGIVLIQGNSIPVQVVQLPFYALLMVIMMLAWSYLVGPIATISKDFESLISTITQTLFWMSGVLYSIPSLADGTVKTLLLLNPFVFIIEGYRKSLLYGEWFFEDMQAFWQFMITIGIMLVLGLYIYKRANRDMVDSL